MMTQTRRGGTARGSWSEPGSVTKRYPTGMMALPGAAILDAVADRANRQAAGDMSDQKTHAGGSMLTGDMRRLNAADF